MWMGRGPLWAPPKTTQNSEQAWHGDGQIRPDAYYLPLVTGRLLMAADSWHWPPIQSHISIPALALMWLRRVAVRGSRSRALHHIAASISMANMFGSIGRGLAEFG